MLTTARVERVNYLPGGKAAMAFEREGELVFRVLESDVTERVALRLTRLMQQEIDSGTWTQNWPGDKPGQPAE
ncbi:hypothetical protein [Streptomyces asiaticus]|uniref:hypothetical protein n=1 Tax=Streptomyces asiaticus TaxID=114695 RepID=UPI0038106610